MKKLLLTFAAILIALSSFAQWGGIKQKGKVKKGNIIVWEKTGTITDSGANSDVLTNVATFTEMVEGTNAPGGFAVLDDQGELDASVMTNSLAPYMVDMDTVARLDENGKLNADVIEYITIVFVGGEAIDVQ